MTVSTFQNAAIQCHHLSKMISRTWLSPSRHGSQSRYQIDGLAIEGNQGIIIEATEQKSSLPAYLRNAVSKFDDLISSPNGLGNVIADNHSRLGISQTDAEKFRNVQSWRLLMVGFFDSSLQVPYNPRNEIFYWEIEDLAYYSKLASAIRTYSSAEILNSLGLASSFLRPWASLGGYVECDAIPAGTRIFKSGIASEVIVFTICPNDLLRLATVRRYGSFDPNAYQRLPDSKRFANMKDFLVSEKSKYLANLIVSLPEGSDLQGNKLKIPRIPFSCPVIDGQHRLYSYTKVGDQLRQQDSLIVTGLRFIKSAVIQPEEKTALEEARIFLSINDKQKKVSPTIREAVKAEILDVRPHAFKVLKIISETSEFRGRFAFVDFVRGVKIASIVKSYLSIHFEQPYNDQTGKGIAWHYHESKVPLNSSDYTLFHNAVAQDLYQYLQAAVKGAKFPNNWETQSGYSSVTCIGGILRAFRWFRNENYYWSNKTRIQEAFSELIGTSTIPDVINNLTARLGGRGPHEFEKAIVAAADNKHGGKLLRGRRTNWI